MERIPIDNPKLEARVNVMIDKLHGYYPDGVIKRLQGQHKSIYKKSSEVAKLVGYNSYYEMFEAYGFTIERNKGGRPVNTNPDEIFDELRRRYAGKPKPRGWGELAEQNPDLAAKLKTLANNSRDQFGEVFGNVLIKEGIIEGKVREDRVKTPQGEIDAMLDDLRECYKGQQDKPKTLKALMDAHPEYKAELEELNRTSTKQHGESAVKYLREIGVLSPGPAQITDESIENMLDCLAMRYRSTPNSEKPSSMAALISDNLDYSDELKACQGIWKENHDTALSDDLRERGIMAYSAVAIKAKRKETIGRSVRNASAADLLELWAAAGNPSIVMLGQGFELPPHVIGVDLEHSIELCEHIYCSTIKGQQDALGDLSVDENLTYATCGLTLTIQYPDGSSLMTKSFSLEDRQFDELTSLEKEDAIQSTLANSIGCTIVSKSNVPSNIGGGEFVQVRMRYLRKLTEQTLINMLYANGLIWDDDLLGGDDWRKRLHPVEKNM